MSRHRLPPELAFSFSDLVATRGEGLLALLGVPLPPSGQVFRDRTPALLLRLEGLAPALLAALGAPGELGRSVAHERRAHELGGEDVFTVRLGNAAGSVTIVLDRVWNGHLGCHEDDVDVVAVAGPRRVTLDAYLFCDDGIEVGYEGLDEAEVAAVEALLREALVL